MSRRSTAPRGPEIPIPQSNNNAANQSVAGTQIGQGAISQVFLVTIPNGQQEVIKQYSAADDLTLRKMRAEMNFLKSANHTNIVKLTRRPDEVAKCLYLEYMDLGSLDRILDKLKLANPPLDSLVRCNLAKAIAVQCLSGLAFIHLKMNRVHRDIKPGNILLNKEGRVKLCDFDCMFNLNDGGNPETETGTTAYMAPEVSKAGIYSTFYDNKSDMWSIGVVLYEVATGASFTKISDMEAQLEAGEGLRDLLQNLLQEKPGDRLDALSALNHPCLRAFTSSTKEESAKNIEDLASAGYQMDIFRFDCPTSDESLETTKNRKVAEESFLHSWRTMDDSKERTSKEKNDDSGTLKTLLLQRQTSAVKSLKDFLSSRFTSSKVETLL